jgi:hypothetical protein
MHNRDLPVSRFIVTFKRLVEVKTNGQCQLISACSGHFSFSGSGRARRWLYCNARCNACYSAEF